MPPYPGHTLDPPFRSRFQARFIDPVGSMLALSSALNEPLLTKLRNIVLSTQYASESRNALEVVSRSELPPFPQTALSKLQLLTLFPPPHELSPGQLARLLLIIHPGLIHASFQAWAVLGRQTQEAGLGELGSPSALNSEEDIGIFGYTVTRIERVDAKTARITFERGAPDASSVTLVVPAGPKPLRPFPFSGTLEFYPTQRFMGLLTSMFQVHALGRDISLLPPPLPSTASSSTSTLVRVFGQLLGYETEAVHMYKELGGRELVMRRRIENGGATTWEPR